MSFVPFRSATLAPLLVFLLCAGARAEVRVVAYVPNWIDLAAFAETIDYSKVTHLNLAFENPINAEGDLSFHPADAKLLAKAKSHQVPVLLPSAGALRPRTRCSPGVTRICWTKHIGRISLRS